MKAPKRSGDAIGIRVHSTRRQNNRVCTLETVSACNFFPAPLVNVRYRENSELPAAIDNRPKANSGHRPSDIHAFYSQVAIVPDPFEYGTAGITTFFAAVNTQDADDP